MESTNTKYRLYLQSDKLKKIAEKRMQIDGYRCQCCESKGTTQNPLEVHHLSYANLYNEENRVYEDLVTLCHLCHKSTHKIMERVTNQNGRRGWKDNPRIPSVHIYNIDGLNIEHKVFDD